MNVYWQWQGQNLPSSPVPFPSSNVYEGFKYRIIKTIAKNITVNTHEAIAIDLTENLLKIYHLHQP